MSELDYAWAAGFFDGEGSISLIHRSDRGSASLRIQITQVDPGVLEWFQELWGGKIYVHNKTRASNARLNFQWIAQHQVAAKFLDDVVLYLRLKQERAQTALRWHKLVAGKRGPQSIEWTIKKRQIVEVMTRLNRRGA